MFMVTKQLPIRAQNVKTIVESIIACYKNNQDVPKSITIIFFVKENLKLFYATTYVMFIFR